MSQPECNPWSGQAIHHYTLRMHIGAHRMAKGGAVVNGVTIGKWLEAAILEKTERDKEE